MQESPIFIIFLTIICIPISQTAVIVRSKPSDTSSLTTVPGAHRFDRLIYSVVRTTGQPDIIHPTVCPPSCEHLHQAVDHMPMKNMTLNSRLNDECSCSCPTERPVYLSSSGSCVEKLEECERTISWKNPIKTEGLVPVVHLFPHSVVLPKTPLDFENSGIIVSPTGQANCSIAKVLYENMHHRWKTPPRRTVLFELTDLDGRPIIYFRGTEFDASFLTGAVVQIKLNCNTQTSSDQSFCVSIRIAGVSGSHTFLNHETNQQDDPGWRIEIVLLFAFVAFVIGTLLITLLIWHTCWKIKKRKMMSDFQLQFIQQYMKSQASKNNHDAQLSIEDIEVEEGGNPNLVSQGRRRLYFSSEYFERELLENPPQMAVQFLYDLKRMIDVAKDRIRQRRYHPTLVTIEEEEHEHPNVEKSRDLDEMTISQESSESSPRSEPKSIDSGRESRDDDSEEDDAKEKEQKVSEIVKNFEKTNATSKRPSQLPILWNSSMRRRKSEPPRLVAPSRLPQPSQVPSRPPTSVSERKMEFESRIRPPTTPTVYGGRSLKERKGYAVFPSDGTINKSLPRRPKKLTPPSTTPPVFN